MRNAKPRRFLETGPLVMDTKRYRAYLKDVDLELSENEFDALFLLAQREGEWIAFEDLYRAVWEPPDGKDLREAARRGLDGMVKAVTAKGRGGPLVEEIPGSGYRFTFGR